MNKKDILNSFSGLDSEEKKGTILEILNSLTLKESADIVTELKEAWGVSDAPVAQVQAQAADSENSGEAKEEKKDFELKLNEFPADKKAKVIKAIKSINASLGLGEIMGLVKDLPASLGTFPKDDANKHKAALEAEGAKVSLV
ncbi:ribosomal protein L7/L12 [Candidatus Nesciobacter abundans]|uniref:ribosomal protein L7/L12 n=1 Tax=Candidatus Nesciobacter abundans TaxID=2601668 RepID=UPI0016537A9C|nr:ribosomal protein L7/L12 [Candidatus Nesciobacter abundans]